MGELNLLFLTTIALRLSIAKPEYFRRLLTKGNAKKCIHCLYRILFTDRQHVLIV